MRLRIVTLDGATREVRANAGDRVAWESWARKQGLPMSPKVTGAGTDSPQVETSTFPVDTYHLYLAWRADTRGLDPRPSFADWLDDKDQVTPVPKDTSEDPTPAGPPDER